MAREFPDLPARSVVRSVRQAVEEFPGESADLVKDAARRKLVTLSRAGSGV